MNEIKKKKKQCIICKKSFVSHRRNKITCSPPCSRRRMYNMQGEWFKRKVLKNPQWYKEWKRNKNPVRTSKPTREYNRVAPQIKPSGKCVECKKDVKPDKTNTRIVCSLVCEKKRRKKIKLAWRKRNKDKVNAYVRKYALKIQQKKVCEKCFEYHQKEHKQS